MAGFENNVVAKPKKSFFFNRSITFQTTSMDSPNRPSLDRTGSGPLKKVYNSMESVWSASNSFKGKVKKLRNLFEPKSPLKNADESQSPSLSPSKLKPTKSINSDYPISPLSPNVSLIRLPGTEDRIVVYFTSLRGIRRTYEDCYAVRMIFRGFRVWVDERDISMDSAYKKELQSVLGEKNNVSLPQVFIKGKYFGGAEVIKQLFEVGELAKILQGFPVREPGLVCQSCGDARFTPCTNCSGSRKVFDEDEGRVMRCLECNENGLIRCPDCCS